MALSSDYDYDLMMLHNESELSLEPQEDHDVFPVYAAAGCTLIFCVSLPGNAFLLWVLLKERGWRTTCDTLLLQLTVSNLCFTLTLPFMAANVLHSWVFGGWTCGVMRWVFSLGMNTYVIILTAMVLHCYITVVHASRLSAQASSKRRVLVVSIVIWLACAAASLKNSVTSEVLNVGYGEVCVVIHSIFMVIFDIYLDIALFFLFPFTIITFCYVHMWITIKQGRINRRDQPSKLILGITVGYFLCMAPHAIMSFIGSLLLMEHIEMKHELLRAIFVIYLLSHLYCLLNPLFYILGAQRFRRYLPVPCNRDGDGSNNDTVAIITLQETFE